MGSEDWTLIITVGTRFAATRRGRGAAPTAGGLRSSYWPKLSQRRRVRRAHPVTSERRRGSWCARRTLRMRWPEPRSRPAMALIIIPATGSAAPQCGAAYPRNATPRSLARPRRTGVRRSQRPRGLKRVRSPVRRGRGDDQGRTRP